MDINLQYAYDQTLSDLGRAVFNVLKATLQYPAEPQAKAMKLADDIKFFDKSSDENTDADWVTWLVVLDIACCIPPDHPWQNSLVQSLDALRQRDESTPTSDSLASEIISSFPITVREKHDALEPPEKSEEGEELGDDCEEFSRWRNYNSFIARITRDHFNFWLVIPMWQLRDTLEEPPMKGSAMRCRIWVASEWIIHCADHLFNFVNTKDDIDESTARAFKGGPLYDGRPPLGVERWQFWKKRFSELAANATSLELDGSTTGRISDALKSMDGVES
ncbi:hypothetical protein Hte_007151 [Hypoxylon texense]